MLEGVFLYIYAEEELGIKVVRGPHETHAGEELRRAAEAWPRRNDIWSSLCA
jgi:hypothetical protein